VTLTILKLVTLDVEYKQDYRIGNPANANQLVDVLYFVETTIGGVYG
jgi:hypothetical protein